MATASDLIAQRLAQIGCRYAFGIPGGEVLAIMSALDRAGIRVILAKHENCAGFMGEGVHHHDGAPAILIATIGPGIANAANVIANAMQERAPMIVLTGCVTALDRHSYTHQVFDHVQFARPITKDAFRVEQGTAAILADKAIAIATGGRPGPVLIDVPVDVQIAEQPESDFPAHVACASMVPAPGSDLDTACRWLAEARRPLLIAGVDVLNQNASEAVREFCRRRAIPLITTYKGKGIIPEDDALSLGGAGLSPRADKCLLPLMKQSDCIILAGYDPIEMRVGWRNPWANDARVIDFSAVANTHYMHQATLNFVGDVGGGLEALADVKPVASWDNGEITRVRESLRGEFPADENWGPAAIIDVCRKQFPRTTVATVDSGAHRILLSQMWQCYAPRTLLQSSALCTMGSAVPLAIGRKLAEPQRPVVAFVGDAGMEMFLGELATLRDLKLSLPIVVFVDSSLALIELKQRNSQYDNLAVDFGRSDFPAVAHALGGKGVWCRERNSLAAEIQSALQRDCFTVIAAVIGDKAYDGRL